MMYHCKGNKLGIPCDESSWGPYSNDDGSEAAPSEGQCDKCWSRDNGEIKPFRAFVTYSQTAEVIIEAETQEEAARLAQKMVEEGRGQYELGEAFDFSLQSRPEAMNLTKFGLYNHEKAALHENAQIIAEIMEEEEETVTSEKSDTVAAV